MRTRIPMAPVGRGGLIAPSIAVSSMAQAKDKREMVVMTQNLYLGSSLNAALGAFDSPGVIIAVATDGTVIFTDFPARAEAIADQIEAKRPDLIVLQEVSTPLTDPRIRASTSSILQQALDDRGLSYSVAAVSDNASIVPFRSHTPCARCSDPLGACLGAAGSRCDPR